MNISRKYSSIHTNINIWITYNYQTHNEKPTIIVLAAHDVHDIPRVMQTALHVLGVLILAHADVIFINAHTAEFLDADTQNKITHFIHFLHTLFLVDTRQPVISISSSNTYLSSSSQEDCRILKCSDTISSEEANQIPHNLTSVMTTTPVFFLA